IKHSKATTFHCRNSTTSCSITVCHLFAFFAKSCSKTRTNGTRCSKEEIKSYNVAKLKVSRRFVATLLTLLPGDFLAIAEKFSGECLCRIGSEPHNRVCALLH